MRRSVTCYGLNVPRDRGSSGASAGQHIFFYVNVHACMQLKGSRGWPTCPGLSRVLGQLARGTPTYGMHALHTIAQLAGRYYTGALFMKFVCDICTVIVYV